MNISLSVGINGKIYHPGENPGIRLELEAYEKKRFRGMLVNETGGPVKLDWFLFSGFEFPGPGPDIRIYRDGWTAVSPAGTLRYGECDLRMNPDYLRFAVVSPEEYTSKVPNRFSGENVVVLNHMKSGKSMLVCFITTARFYNRFQIELQESGLKTLNAFVLGDGREIDDGETVFSEELFIQEGTDAYGLLEQYGERLGQTMHALSLTSPVPTGWCSWYYYFSRLTEQNVQENLAWLQSHPTEFPFDYIQIDDGYQRTPGDWLGPSEQFPHGIAATIRKIAETGFKPGLWLAPFIATRISSIYQKHPEFLLHDSSGAILHPFKWRGTETAVLDCTRKDVQNWLRELFATVRILGCSYVKLDFMMYESCVKDAVFHDRKATRCDAFRMGLQAIRDGIGEDAFILGGTVVMGPCVGLINGARYAPDITPYWRRPERSDYMEEPSLPNVIRNLILRRYMHRHLWLNDPDVHIARRDNNQLTDDEIHLWTSALFLIGGSLFLSDRFSTLTPDRAELSKLLLSESDGFDQVRPEDFFEREIPAVWSGIRKRNGESVLGLFNLYDDPLPLQIKLENLAVPVQSEWKEFWSGKIVNAINGVLEISLPPHTAQLLFYAH